MGRGVVVALLLVGCAAPQSPSLGPGATSGATPRTSRAVAPPPATPPPAPARLIAKVGPMLVTAPGTPQAGQPVARPLGEQPRCEQVCGPSIVTLRWQPAGGTARQRIQMVRTPSEFVPQVALESQDKDPTTSEIEWRVLYAGTRNYWRIVSEIGGGWMASP